MPLFEILILLPHINSDMDKTVRADSTELPQELMLLSFSEHCDFLAKYACIFLVLQIREIS